MESVPDWTYLPPSVLVVRSFTLLTLSPASCQGLHPDFPGQSSPEALGTVEHFFLELMSVPRPEERLAVLMYIRSYGPGVQQLRNLARLITEPTALISDSPDFALLLRMVLEVGSY